MPDEDIEQKIFQDLQLEALRVIYHQRGSYEVINSSRRRIFLGSYRTGSPSDEADMREQQKNLYRNLRLATRGMELRADGIYPFFEVEREYAGLYLSAFADVSPRGLRLLEGKGIALSGIIRSVRRTFMVGYWALAVLLIPIYFWERIGKQGLTIAVATLAACLIFQYFWMRLFRRDV
jgi:hypothetical protein